MKRMQLNNGVSGAALRVVQRMGKGMAVTSLCAILAACQTLSGDSAPVAEVQGPLRTVPADQIQPSAPADDRPVEIASAAGSEPPSLRTSVAPDPASASVGAPGPAVQVAELPPVRAAQPLEPAIVPSAAAQPVADTAADLRLASTLSSQASDTPDPLVGTPDEQVASGLDDDREAEEMQRRAVSGGDPNAGPNSRLPDPPRDFRDPRNPGLHFGKAMEQIYLFNPTIRAARRELGAVNEGINIARAGRLPTATANAIISPTQSYTVTDENIEPEPNDQVIANTSFTLRASINQVLWSGGRVPAAIEQAEAQVLAQRATLFSVEQQVLLNGALAFLDVARDQRILALNENNIEVLARQQQATQDRFDVGEATISEVEQARARVERARGDAATARATLQTSRATFYQFVADYPEDRLPLPAIMADLPQTLQDAIDRAETNNPTVLAAEAAYAAALAGVDVAFAELMPFLDLTGTATYTQEPANRLDHQRSLAAEVTLTIPIFTGGRNYASVRQNKFTANQRMIEIEEAKRSARQQAEAGWETYRATLSVIEARKAEVDAAQVALEGIREEWRVGSRPLLDVLDAEQDLLNAQVALTTAERDNLAAVLQLISATGDMDPASLDLNVAVYNPVPEYENTRNKLTSLTVE